MNWNWKLPNETAREGSMPRQFKYIIGIAAVFAIISLVTFLLAIADVIRYAP